MSAKQTIEAAALRTGGAGAPARLNHEGVYDKDQARPPRLVRLTPNLHALAIRRKELVCILLRALLLGVGGGTALGILDHELVRSTFVAGCHFPPADVERVRRAFGTADAIV